MMVTLTGFPTITRYRVEQWSENLERWIDAGIVVHNLEELPEVIAEAVDGEDPNDPLRDPWRRQLVEIRETVIPWPEGGDR
jgi:hypothetical protein